MAREKKEKREKKPVAEFVAVEENVTETPSVAKKEKKEKKVKKDEATKTSDEEPIEATEDATMTDAPAENRKEKKKEKKDRKEKKPSAKRTDSVDDATAAETDEPAQADTDTATPAGTKRKVDMEELQVDLTAPEPPSKRAKRALKKGKSVKSLAKKDGSDNDDDDGNDSDDDGKKKKKKKERSEHSVWIGNLPFFLTAADLKKWLVDNSGGVIEDQMITRVKLPTQKDAAREKGAKPFNKGFAYVDFSEVGAKVAAIALSETELSMRKLLIKDATSFEGRPKKEAEAAEETEGPGGMLGPGGVKVDPNASRKIFVGNMSFQTTEQDVHRNFEPCGEIEWVKIATFEDSGKCKGFGWVKFQEPEAAAWAVKGFVKIKEPVETEEDFKDDEDRDTSQEKKFKTRKWYVNRIQGRELKLELAEDDQTRYKKRFKGKPREEGAQQNGEAAEGPANGGGRPRRDGGGQAKPKTAKNIDVARLTGGLVEHTGSKVSFD